MKILFILDDIWHPAEVIRMGMQGIDSEKYQVDYVITAKDILTPEYIAPYPVIINAKGNAINAANSAPWFEPSVTEVGPAELKAYIEAGGGFLSLHAANTFMKNDCREYCSLVGNSYRTHPLRCPVTVKPVGTHPITEGVLPFTERDEQYILDIDAPDKQVFLESESEPGGKQIAGYTRELGKGRICVMIPGHTLSVWRNQNFLHLLANAIDWAAHKK